VWTPLVDVRLLESEVVALFADLDKDRNGYIDRADVEAAHSTEVTDHVWRKLCAVVESDEKIGRSVTPLVVMSAMAVT
jgi:Ca2+-binding EF-hand superfamily protein